MTLPSPRLPIQWRRPIRRTPSTGPKTSPMKPHATTRYSELVVKSCGAIRRMAAPFFKPPAFRPISSHRPAAADLLVHKRLIRGRDQRLFLRAVFVFARCEEMAEEAAADGED